MTGFLWIGQTNGRQMGPHATLAIRAWAQRSQLPFIEELTPDSVFFGLSNRYRARYTQHPDLTLIESSPWGLTPSIDAQTWFKCLKDPNQFPAGPRALVVVRKEPRQISLYRDRLGVATLYYHLSRDRVYVASEARFIAMVLEAFPRPNQSALVAWMRFQYHDQVTLFEGIQGVQRGTVTHISQDREHVIKVPLTPFNGAIKDKDSAAETLREIIRESTATCIDRQHVTGCSLSSGMDSTSLAAIASRRCNAKIHGFGYRFRELNDCDESAGSKSVAQHLGIPLHLVDCDDFPILSRPFYPEPAFPENPFDSWNQVTATILDRLGELGGSVMLMGHGGDSMLMGIPPMGWKNRLKRLLQRFGWYPYEPSPALPWLTPKAKTLMAERDLVVTTRRGQQSQMAWDCGGGIRRAMHWNERVARHFGCVVRHPFMNERLLQFVLAIDPALLWSGRPKGLFRESMRGLLPDLTVDSQHKPHLLSFYRKGVEEYYGKLTDYSQNSRLGDLGLIDPETLISCTQDFVTGHTASHGWMIFTLFTELWLRMVFPD